jgi:ABC-type sugar transport system substrate-binding protein
MGVSAARAAHELGRDDVVVVTVDDSPNTYNEIRTLPTMWAGTGFTGQLKEMNEDVFNLLEKVFKGESVPSQQFHPFLARMVTKENLPPKGYFVNPLGYKGRKADFTVK